MWALRYIATISAGAKQLKRAQSAIMDALNRIIRFVSIMIIPVGALLFLKQLSIDGNTPVSGGGVHDGGAHRHDPRRAGAADQLGAGGQCDPAVASPGAGAGACIIEALARVDVLCLDKTGTITEGRMELHDMVPLGEGSACRQSTRRAGGCAG